MESLKEQTIRICRRPRLIRSTLLALLSDIASLVLTSLSYGDNIFWPRAAVGAAIFFIISMQLLLAAVGCAAAEVLYALGPAELEAGVVSELIGFPSDQASEFVTASPSARSPTRAA